MELSITNIIMENINSVKKKMSIFIEYKNYPYYIEIKCTWNVKNVQYTYTIDIVITIIIIPKLNYNIR